MDNRFDLIAIRIELLINYFLLFLWKRFIIYTASSEHGNNSMCVRFTPHRIRIDSNVNENRIGFRLYMAMEWHGTICRPACVWKNVAANSTTQHHISGPHFIIIVEFSRSYVKIFRFICIFIFVYFCVLIGSDCPSLHIGKEMNESILVMGICIWTCLFYCMWEVCRL